MSDKSKKPIQKEELKKTTGGGVGNPPLIGPAGPIRSAAGGFTIAGK